jgi:hypothetical protein
VCVCSVSLLAVGLPSKSSPILSTLAIHQLRLHAPYAGLFRDSGAKICVPYAIGSIGALLAVLDENARRVFIRRPRHLSAVVEALEGDDQFSTHD